MARRSLAQLTKGARYLVGEVMAAKNIARLAWLIGAAEASKKKRLITAAELAALYELGAKKEALLRAQGVYY